MKKKSFISGAVILMAAGFIVRIFGFVYRIYLSNLIGAEGMGLFQLIAPVYSLVILTLTSGVSIAVSKMVAEEHARNHPINLNRITGCALAIVSASGLMVSLLMYFNMDFMVGVILKDSRTYYSLLLMLPCIPVVAAASAVKGYFYGLQDVTPTAISQVVEQIVKIGIVMTLAGQMLSLGLEYACALATVAMAAGEIANLAVVYIVYIYRRNKNRLNISRAGIMRKRRIIGDIVRISLPVSSNRFISSILSAVEYILIPRRLLAGGLNYQASMVEFGKLSGMAMPLIFFPSLVTSSLATTLVPAISDSLSRKNFRTANYRISKSIQFTFILGFLFTSVFAAYPDDIADLVYRRQNVGAILYLLSFSCVFIYLQQTLLGILNGLGKQGISLRNSLIGSVIRIGFVYYIIPMHGLRGYVVGIIISSALVCILDLHSVIKTTGMALDLRNWIVKPGIVGAFMIFSGKYIYSFFTIFEASDMWTLVSTLIGNVIIGIALMVIIGVLQKDEVFKLLGLKRLSRRKSKSREIQ